MAYFGGCTVRNKIVAGESGGSRWMIYDLRTNTDTFITTANAKVRTGMKSYGNWAFSWGATGVQVFNVDTLEEIQLNAPLSASIVAYSYPIINEIAGFVYITRYQAATTQSYILDLKTLRLENWIDSAEQFVFGTNNHINPEETYFITYTGGKLYQVKDFSTPFDKRGLIDVCRFVSTDRIQYPRKTTAERDALTNVLGGTTIFNTTTNQINTYDGTTWRVINWT